MPDPTFTYDLDEPAGKVRLLISDVGGGDSSSFVFNDKEIEAFLNMWEQDLFMAAALALRTMAGNEAMVAKKITFLELETDGPAMAKAMNELADKFTKMADENVDFELIEMGVDMFSRNEIRREQFGAFEP